MFPLNEEQQVYGRYSNLKMSSSDSRREWTYPQAILADCDRISGEILRDMRELEEMLDTVSLDTEACALFAPLCNDRVKADLAPTTQVFQQQAQGPNCPLSVAGDFGDIECVTQFADGNWDNIDELITCYLANLQKNDVYHSPNAEKHNSDLPANDLEKLREVDLWLANLTPESELGSDSDDTFQQKNQITQEIGQSTPENNQHELNKSPQIKYYYQPRETRQPTNSPRNDMLQNENDSSTEIDWSPTINSWSSTENTSSPKENDWSSTDFGWVSTDTEQLPKDNRWAQKKNAKLITKERSSAEYDRSLLDDADELIKEIDSEMKPGNRNSNNRRWTV